jgi:hypothetical protein
MATIPLPQWRSVVNPARHWLLVHAGRSYSLSWDDGERLLALSSDVCAGKAEAQYFSFTPLRPALGQESVAVLVDPTQSFNLLTENDSAESHWFG